MRLIQDLRRRIYTALLFDTFTARWAALAERESALAFKLRDHAAGAAMEVMATLPESFVRRRSYITVTAEPDIDFMALHFHPTRVRVVDVGADGEEIAPYNAVGLAPGHNLARSAIALRRDMERLQADCADLRAQVCAALDCVTTVAKLVDQWPEVQRFLPLATATQNLPAIPVPELNQRIAAAGAV